MYSGGSWGAAGGARVPPLFFDQNEARRAEKIFLETGRPPYLRVWMRGLPVITKKGEEKKKGKNKDKQQKHEQKRKEKVKAMILCRCMP